MSVRRRFPFLVVVFGALLNLLAVAGAWANPVTPAQAEQVAQNLVNYIVARDGAWGASQVPEIAAVEPVFRDGVLVAFVAVVSPSGFVLIPAEDELPAVKAFSTSGPFEQRPGLFWDYVALELEELVGALRRDREVAAVFGPENRKLWERLDKAPSRFDALAEAAPGVVSPILLTSKWDQGDGTGSLYNNDCPQVSGTYCPVGCVATAAAQIMRYWNYPTKGVGNHSYSWNGQTLSADFTKTYDWANMPDALSIRSTQAQKAAVATLGYDLAVSVEMSFAPDGSGAITADVEDSLEDYFRYSTDANVKSYTGSDSSWFPLFTAQVDAKRPLEFAIRGTSGGHAVVVDGYRTDTGNMVHINMGWGGASDGYYALNNISGSWFSFKSVSEQYMVRDIHPGFEAAVTASPASGGAPLTVNFSVNLTGGTGPFTYDWDFGDGSAHASTLNTSHVYTASGTYTATFKATDAAGNVAQKKTAINVGGSGQLSASATASPTSGIAPLAVQFTGAASGGTSPYTYEWSFGDGGTGTGATESHTYTAGGTFTATLTVRDAASGTASAAATVQAHVAIAVSSMSKAGNPFRFNVNGSNFLSGIQVFIGTDTSPWATVSYKNSSKIVIKGGSALKAKVPKGVPTAFRFLNPDGGEATHTFTW
jgi:PKD repeat protein